MSEIQLFAVTEDGAQRLALPQAPRSMYDLPEGLALGVYTALRTFEGYKFLQLGDHLERLQTSVSLLRWRYKLDTDAVRRALHEACLLYGNAYGDARVRIDVLARPASVLGSRSRVLVTLAPFTPPPAVIYEQGVRLGLAPRLHRARPRAKTADFVEARRPYQEHSREWYDVLLLDGEQRLLEGSTSNFYAVRDGVVLTAGSGVLEGITRKVALHLIDAEKIPLQLEAPRLVEVPTLEEAFISSSSRGFVPVREIDGHTIPAAPGPVTQHLMQVYAQYVARNIRAAIELTGDA